MVETAESIPTRQPTAEETIRFLREKLDQITDPNVKYDNPDVYGNAILGVVRYLVLYPEVCFSSRVKYNLGKRRSEHLQQLAAALDAVSP